MTTELRHHFFVLQNFKAQKMKRIIKVAILIIAAAVTIPMVFKAFSISPVAWQPASKVPFSGASALNEKLATAQKISLKGWYGPEDIVF